MNIERTQHQYAAQRAADINLTFTATNLWCTVWYKHQIANSVTHTHTHPHLHTWSRQTPSRNLSRPPRDPHLLHRSSPPQANASCRLRSFGISTILLLPNINHVPLCLISLINKYLVCVFFVSCIRLCPVGNPPPLFLLQTRTEQGATEGRGRTTRTLEAQPVWPCRGNPVRTATAALRGKQRFSRVAQTWTRTQSSTCCCVSCARLGALRNVLRSRCGQILCCFSQLF